MNNKSDKEILVGISEGDQKILEYLYKNLRPRVIDKIVKIGGTQEDGVDIFQIVIFRIFSLLQEKGVEIKDFFNYFISACVYEYYNSFTQKGRATYDQELFENIPDNFSSESEGMIRFISAFNRLEEDCKRLLRLRSDKVTYQEIAEIMGYSSVGYAQNKRERCVKYFHKLFRKED